MSEQSLAPLVRWDGLHLVLNMAMLEQRLQQLIRNLDWVEDVMLGGAGDAVQVLATFILKGRRVRARFELAEVRLRYRYVGFRIRRFRALGRLPVPISVIEFAIRQLAPDIVKKAVHGHGIMVVDLRQWLPAELALSVLTVQATDQALHVWFGPGELGDIPATSRPALTAGDESRPGDLH
jgi:hypothetical protein